MVRLVARAPYIVLYLVGICEGMLLARLVARLLAARPDNPAMQALYTLTDPLVGLLHGLDAQQPRFGAVLELSTLVLVTGIAVLGYGIWRLVVYVAIQHTPTGARMYGTLS